MLYLPIHTHFRYAWCVSERNGMCVYLLHLIRVVVGLLWLLVAAKRFQFSFFAQQSHRESDTPYTTPRFGAPFTRRAIVFSHTYCADRSINLTARFCVGNN